MQSSVTSSIEATILFSVYFSSKFEDNSLEICFSGTSSEFKIRLNHKVRSFCCYFSSGSSGLPLNSGSIVLPMCHKAFHVIIIFSLIIGLMNVETLDMMFFLASKFPIVTIIDYWCPFLMNSSTWWKDAKFSNDFVTVSFAFNCWLTKDEVLFSSGDLESAIVNSVSRILSCGFPNLLSIIILTKL